MKKPHGFVLGNCLRLQYSEQHPLPKDKFFRSLFGIQQNSKENALQILCFSTSTHIKQEMNQFATIALRIHHPE